MTKSERWVSVLAMAVSLAAPLGCEAEDPAATGPIGGGAGGAAGATCDADEGIVSRSGPGCAPLATDYRPREAGSKDDAWPACVSDGDEYVRFGESISSLGRVAAFEEIAQLLGFGGAKAPTPEDFLDARVVYSQEQGLESRVSRREDEHYPAASELCRDMTAEEQASHPDRCVGPVKIRPILNAAFVAGIAGEDPVANAARIEAALLWFFYTSVYKESVTCATAIADCDSSHAYYSAGTARAQPAAMARYMNAIDPYIHDRIFDGTLGTHCWRELDNGATAMNLAQQAIALDQLDVALDHGAARLLIERVRAWAAAAGDERTAQWGFVQIWGQALDRAVRVRDAAAADRLATLFAGDGAGVDVATVEDILLPLMPCP